MNQRIGQRFVAVFVAWHISCELLTGAHKSVRRWVAPVIDFYSDGLRMTNTWGMFSLKPPREEVLVIAETRQHGPVELSTNYTSQREGLSRISDLRQRKIQSYLKEENHRDAWGQQYLDYYCRLALEHDPSTERVELWIRDPVELDDSGEIVEREVGRRVLKQQCHGAK